MADALYNRHAKPLESEHWGKYIAVSASGETVVGADIADVRYRSLAQLGRGVFVFKIGDKVVGKVRMRSNSSPNPSAAMASRSGRWGL